MTIEPLSSSQTFTSRLQRLPNRDELPGPRRAQLVDLLRRVVVEPAARLHPEPALLDPVANRLRDLTGRGEIRVQVGTDGVVDVEPGHVQELHWADHRQL